MSDRTIVTDQEARAYLATPITWAVLPQTMILISSVASGLLTVEAAVEAASAVRREDPERAEDLAAGADGPQVAVLALRGLITPRGAALCGPGDGGLEGFQSRLYDAAVDDGVASILIDIDSPGGQTDLVDETAALVRDAAAEKPVVAAANTMAASAAYYIASGASEVVVTPSGLVGSIGTFASHVDMSKAEEMRGIKTTLISAGRHKVDANPHEPLSPDGRRGLQELVDDAYDQFVAAVALGRGVTDAAVREGFGQGRVLTAKRALAAGMVDRIEPIRETIARMTASAGEAPAEPAAEPAAASAEATPSYVSLWASGRPVGEWSPATDEAPPETPEATADPDERRAQLEYLAELVELGLA